MLVAYTSTLNISAFIDWVYCLLYSPAKCPEPRQVIGMVDVISNHNNLLETFNLYTHYLQKKIIKIYLCLWKMNRRKNRNLRKSTYNHHEYNGSQVDNDEEKANHGQR